MFLYIVTGSSVALIHLIGTTLQLLCTIALANSTPRLAKLCCNKAQIVFGGWQASFNELHGVRWNSSDSLALYLHGFIHIFSLIFKWRARPISKS